MGVAVGVGTAVAVGLGLRDDGGAEPAVGGRVAVGISVAVVAGVALPQADSATESTRASKRLHLILVRSRRVARGLIGCTGLHGWVLIIDPSYHKVHICASLGNLMLGQAAGSSDPATRNGRPDIGKCRSL